MISRIWTIGHSTRTIDIFISLLEENGIKLVADVRTLPGSKRYPQFNKEMLARSLTEHGIRYEHFPELGGRRKQERIRTIQLGATLHFELMPITWKPKNFVPALSGLSISQPNPGRRR
jgi:uncharacterized protein (DUF488 family)